MNRQMVEPYLNPMTPQPTHLPVKGGLRPPIKCLLCDIYGTLLISGSGDIGLSRQQVPQSKALANLTEAFGILQNPVALRQDLLEAIEKEHQRRNAEGIAHPEVEIDKIWSRLLPFDDVKKIRSFAIQWEMVVNPVWPMPGLSDLINTCRNNRIALGIISNAQFYTPLLFKWFLGADLERHGFVRQLLLYSYRHGRAKPSNYLFLLAADRLQAMKIVPEQVVFIGNDMRNDIAPAFRAGFQTILFAGDARSLRMRNNDPTCQDVSPDLQITHLSQLVSRLDKASFDRG